MFTVHTDVKMTRRKSLCHITDNSGEPVWSGGRIGEAFDYLLEKGIYHFILEHEAGACRVMIGRVNH